MTSPAVLTIVVTVSTTITSGTSYYQESCTNSITSTTSRKTTSSDVCTRDLSVSREELASWLENIFSLDWELMGPGTETEGECEEVLSVSWCSWGQCGAQADYTGSLLHSMLRLDSRGLRASFLCMLMP